MNGRTLNLLIVGAALLLAAGLGVRLLGGPGANGQADTAAPPSPGATETTGSGANQTEPDDLEIVTETGARVVFEGAGEEDEAASVDDPAAVPLNTLPPAELALTDVVSYERENGMDVLVLRDGSELLVTDFVYEKLPESIRFRLEYQREPQR